jgi:hypothetical protein
MTGLCSVSQRLSREGSRYETATCVNIMHPMKTDLRQMLTNPYSARCIRYYKQSLNVTLHKPSIVRHLIPAKELMNGIYFILLFLQVRRNSVLAFSLSLPPQYKKGRNKIGKTNEIPTHQ